MTVTSPSSTSPSTGTMPPARTTTASPGWIWDTGTSTSPWAVRSQTRSTFSDMHRARSATDFFLVHSSSSSPTSSRNMTIPAVPKSLLQAEMEIDRASSSSTLMRRRSRQRSPRRTKGIMCQSMRAIRNGGGRNRVQAALHTTLVTSFSSNSRFSARLLWADSAVVRSASCQEKCRISFSTAWRVPS